MADSGPLWGLVGALGGSIVSQVLNSVLASRRERAADLRAQLEELAKESRAGRAELGSAIGDVRTKVAGLEAVVSAFVVSPAERRRSPRRGE